MQGVPPEIVYTASFRGSRSPVQLSLHAFSRPSLATIMVIPSRVVQVKSRGWRGLGGEYEEGGCEYGECVSVGRVEVWEKVRIVGV